MRHKLPIVLIFIAALWWPGAASEARLGQEEMYQLAHEAHSLFRQGNEFVRQYPQQASTFYDQAILRFQRIIDEGQIANAELYYNIGNAYLLKGDVGQAILYYRRAQRLGGHNLEVEKNLAYARSQRVDQIPVRAQKRVLETVFFWYYDLSGKTRFVLACWLWAGAFLAGSGWLWWRKGRFLRWVMLAALPLALLFAATVAVDMYRRHHDVEGVILAESVVARQGDGDNYAASFTEPLHRGTEFRRLEERSGWQRIELWNGQQAWVPSGTVGII